ncbi:MAG TPA: trehalose-phosphatase [Gemmatimonadaceae bacterium]|nr:trehalose-phosphatase [Gemmatimonadaceae bacterium]
MTPSRFSDATREAVADRLSHSPLLVALDIDGTLAPIAPTPDQAAVPPRTRETLERLTRLPNVHVAFVTGRAAADGRQLVAVADSWTIGNHGIEIVDPGGALRVNTAAEAYAPAVARAVELLRDRIGNVRGVLVENKRWTVSVHFRLADADSVPTVERAVASIAHEVGLRELAGKKIFELRPPIAIHKGVALRDLAGTLGVFRGDVITGSLLYVGDDRTDEDAFRVLPPPAGHAVTAHVGPAELPDGQRTIAELLLDDPAAVHDFLEWLAGVRQRTPARA